MKRIFLFLIVIAVSCSRDRNHDQNTDWFQIEIKNACNIDCGLPEIAFLTNQSEAYRIIENDMGRYIALGLPKANYTVGDRLLVKIGKPKAEEQIACTAMGFAWAHILYLRSEVVNKPYQK